jgi:hypothetical protein
MKHTAHMRAEPVPQPAGGPTCPPTDQQGLATKGRSFATEQTMLIATPSTLRQSVTPSTSRRRHSDEDFTVLVSATQTTHGIDVTSGRDVCRCWHSSPRCHSSA